MWKYVSAQQGFPPRVNFSKRTDTVGGLRTGPFSGSHAQDILEFNTFPEQPRQLCLCEDATQRLCHFSVVQDSVWGSSTKSTEAQSRNPQHILNSNFAVTVLCDLYLAGMLTMQSLMITL